jgi:hypothetical protein
LAWWSDADLRAELHRRIPGLGEEIAPNSPAETKIRNALVALLKTKGIAASVQVHEPDADYASHRRILEAPPASIVFSVASPPLISIDSITLDGAPADITDALQKAAEIRNGTIYSTQNFWSIELRLKEALGQAGYLTGKVSIAPGRPVQEGNDFKVPLTAVIASGPQFHVAEIKCSGGPLLVGRDLSPYYTLHPGDIATPNPFGRLAGSIRSVYWQAGYPDVAMNSEPVLDTANALAFYDFQVEPGPLYHLRSINILHLTEAQQAVVTALLKMKPGDIYDGMATARLSQSLRTASSPLPGFDFSYNQKLDKAEHVVDLTLDFFKRQ